MGYLFVDGCPEKPLFQGNRCSAVKRGEEYNALGGEANNNAAYEVYICQCLSYCRKPARDAGRLRNRDLLTGA